MKSSDPRELLAADFRGYMTDLCRRAREVNLDAADIVAFLFRWVVETAPRAATNDAVRSSLLEAIDTFLATRPSGSGQGPGADFGILGIEERKRLLAALDRVPSAYRIKTDVGWWQLEEPSTLARYHESRDDIVRGALGRGLKSAEISTVLLELSATLLAPGMSRQTFLDNAAFWYDTIRDVEARVNGKGGDA